MYWANFIIYIIITSFKCIHWFELGCGPWASCLRRSCYQTKDINDIQRGWTQRDTFDLAPRYIRGIGTKTKAFNCRSNNEGCRLKIPEWLGWYKIKMGIFTMNTSTCLWQGLWITDFIHIYLKWSWYTNNVQFLLFYSFSCKTVINSEYKIMWYVILHVYCKGNY